MKVKEVERFPLEKRFEGMIEGAGEACQAGRDGGEIGSNLEREERESARVEERESARVD